MKITLLLLAILGLSYSVVIKQHARKSGSLRSKLIKEGTFHEFLAKQHLARAASNSAVASQPIIDYYDDFYLVDIGLGTPYQNFTMSLDTGSANLWVIDASCTTNACKGKPDTVKHLFRTDASSTFVKTSQPFFITYGIGNCSGYVATDRFNLAGLVYPTQGLGVATSIADEFGQQPVDGVLGLGWPALDANNIVPPMQNLLDQLDQPIFTVWLDRHVKHEANKPGGMVTYGGLDTEHCDAQVDYVSLSSKTYWQFPMTGFSFGDYSSNAREEAISDTGVSWIGAPAAAVSAILKATSAKYDWFFQLYSVRCAGTYPDMIFKIGGKQYSIPSSEYVLDLGMGFGNCALTLFEMQGGGFGPAWTLGDTWIRTYCNVHDIGQGRIGFAKAHHTEI